MLWRLPSSSWLRSASATWRLWPRPANPTLTEIFLSLRLDTLSFLVNRQTSLAGSWVVYLLQPWLVYFCLIKFLIKLNFFLSWLCADKSGDSRPGAGSSKCPAKHSQPYLWMYVAQCSYPPGPADFWWGKGLFTLTDFCFHYLVSDGILITEFNSFSNLVCL